MRASREWRETIVSALWRDHTGQRSATITAQKRVCPQRHQTITHLTPADVLLNETHVGPEWR